jgi:hypothetical protein
MPWKVHLISSITLDVFHGLLDCLKRARFYLALLSGLGMSYDHPSLATHPRLHATARMANAMAAKAIVTA